MSNLEQIVPWVNAIGVPGLLAVGLYAFHKGWVVTGREHDEACKDCDALRTEDRQRYLELRAERDEWKAAALRHLDVAESAVSTASRVAQHATNKGGAR